MRQADLAGRAPRRWTKATIPDPAAAARADAIRRDLTADASRLTSGGAATSPTSPPMKDGCTHRDRHRRRVVGFALADHLRTEVVADALANAVAARDPAPGVIFHSDRGCQPGSRGRRSTAYAALAAGCQVTLPAGHKGRCWDNAAAKGFSPH
jgi:transposase InsO family protein